MRIVVVDDEANTATAISALLRANGHDALTCFAGNDVMEMIERLRPEALLLDLSMPGMNGYDVAEELRLNPDLRPRLVIAVTAWGRPDDLEQTHHAGFDQHLVKPVAWNELQAALQGIGDAAAD